MKAMLSSLCTPAVIYLVLAVISLIVGLMYKFSIMTIVTKGFFVLLWTWILNFLCKKGFKDNVVNVYVSYQQRLSNKTNEFCRLLIENKRHIYLQEAA